MPPQYNIPGAFVFDEMIHEMASEYKQDPVYISETYTSLDYALMKCLQAKKIKIENKLQEQALKK